MRVRLALAVAVIAAAAAVAALARDDTPEPQPTAPIATIAERVERLRGVDFKTEPEPVRVSAKQAKEEGLADLDRGYPVARRRADEALYTLLGLLPPGTDLRDITGSIFGDQVAGYYDPRTKELRIVEGTGNANRVLDETVIAHELTHALEDQRFPIDLKRSQASDDAGYAYKALLEGTATLAMNQYTERHFKPDVALGGLLGGAFNTGGIGELPPFVVASLVFPYIDGEVFASDLYKRAGRSWTLLDSALRDRPPASTEQILHPEKYLAAEAPERVELLRALGDGWKRLTSGTFGEWQTRQLLSLSGRMQPDAAAGWAGDRYELWRRDGGEPCKSPCPERDALIVEWRWDDAGEAAEFVPVLRAAVGEAIKSPSAIEARGRSVRLALAPEAGLAARLARAGAP